MVKDIKKKLHATTVAVSTIPQKNGKYIVMERCVLRKKPGQEITIMYEDDDRDDSRDNSKAVIVCARK